MTQARKRLLSTEVMSFYPVIARCVRMSVMLTVIALW